MIISKLKVNSMDNTTTGRDKLTITKIEDMSSHNINNYITNNNNYNSNNNSNSNKVVQLTKRNGSTESHGKSKPYRLEINKTTADVNPELFSDRSSNKNTNITGSFTLGKFDKRALATNMSTLFRQSNKVSNKSNESSGKIINLLNLKVQSPIKKLKIIKDSTKPIEEILKTTKKMIETKRVNEDNNYNNQKTMKNNKEIYQKLREIKSRTLNLLNKYSEGIVKK
jgi:hypothetical protein